MGELGKPNSPFFIYNIYIFEVLLISLIFIKEIFYSGRTMVDITDFDIGQGETFKILAHIYTEISSSIPLDITNHEFIGQIRENYTTEEIATEFTITKIPPLESGSIFISLTPQQTLALDQRTYVYDLLMISTGSFNPSEQIVRRVLEGAFTIRPAVTRDY
jgi:hypothetical protein